MREHPLDAAVRLTELARPATVADERDPDLIAAARALAAVESERDRLREALEAIMARNGRTVMPHHWTARIARAALAGVPGDHSGDRP